MPHDSYPPAQQNSRKCPAKFTSPSSDHRKDTVFREFFRDLLSVWLGLMQKSDSRTCELKRRVVHWQQVERLDEAR